MHSPETLLHENWFFEVWHRDPETDGSDDSCGWARPKLNGAERKLAKEFADWERRFPYFVRKVSKQPGGVPAVNPGTALALTLAAFSMIAWRLDRRRSLSASDIAYATAIACSHGDN